MFQKEKNVSSPIEKVLVQSIKETCKDDDVEVNELVLQLQVA